ncbi:MAG: gluconokinase [Acidobacteriota bacterium]|nr:MAG: gluconokinase [Acidobacteriota bacterium]
MPAAKAPCILGIDIGTSGMRAEIFDADMLPIPRLAAKTSRTPEASPDGGSFFDAEKHFAEFIWLIDRVAAAASDRGIEIDSVGWCAFWHGILGVDELGKATTTLLTWADRRSREFTPRLKVRFDEAETHRRTGAHFHSSFWPARLLWFRERHVDAWRRTSRWCSFSDLIAERLFGECVTSISMASATGVFDQRNATWDGELLRYLKVKRATLPRIAADGEAFTLSRKYARRWPVLAHAKWLPAIGDGAADHLGSCGVSPHTASLMIGTSAAMRVAFEGDVPAEIPQGLWCYRIDSKRFIVGGALSDGGNLHALIRERFRLPKNCDALVTAREPDDNLVVIPFFFGERSTGYDEDARGAIIGMTAEHDGIDVLRAAMEGVAFRLADIMTRLEAVTDIKTIVAAGGALRQSPAWQQIVADAIGRDIAINDTDGSSLRGSATFAGNLMMS